MRTAASHEVRFRQRVWDVAQALLVDRTIDVPRDESTPADAAEWMAALERADPAHGVVWSLVLVLAGQGEFDRAGDLLTDLYLQLLLANVSAHLERRDSAGATDRRDEVQPADRLAAIRSLARRYPPCTADFERVLALFESGDKDGAVRHVERMVRGMARKASDILWPPATHTSWVRILTNMSAPAVRPDLDGLLAAYWMPVRELLQRTFGLDAGTAESVTSDFFGDAVVKNSLARYDPNAGSRFRDYLATAVHHFYPKWRNRQRTGQGRAQPLPDDPRAPAAVSPEPDAHLDCSLWRWKLSTALADARTRLSDRDRGPEMWEVFEARLFAGPGTPPTHEVLAKRFGRSAYQVNNYLHQVRKVLVESLRGIPGEGTGRIAVGFKPPSCCAEDARFTFAERRVEAVAGRSVPVRVLVRDASGHHNPLSSAPGVRVVVACGTGTVTTLAPQRLQGVLLERRYVRLVEAVVHSAEAGEATLALSDELGTGLDVSDRMTLVFRPARGKA
ncbi:MAG: sigma-70 family RNA polymerase sigma factor [Planctomycetes bacterium]|nr:sigma-70 family RNA polymerase sigma factor [Planctomycetota bacterium]